MPAGSSPKKWGPALIKLLRGKRTQKEFGRLLGAPKNTVWRWETGNASPAAAYARKLSQIATQEGFLSGWQPVGSVTWVGDLDEGTKEIASIFPEPWLAGRAGQPRNPGCGFRPRCQSLSRTRIR